MPRLIVMSTYNKADVLEPERVFRYMEHSLNQLQKRCFDRHAQRLNTILSQWSYSGVPYEVQFCDRMTKTCRLKQGIYPAIYCKEKGTRWRSLDLYGIYNIFPVLGGKLALVPNYYPYLPSNREFYYMADLTDFRQLHDRSVTPLEILGI